MEDLKKRYKLYISKFVSSKKTNNCLDINTLGNYLEGKLTQGESRKVEDHIKGCLACLNQLSDLRELIHLESYAEPLPQHLLVKLRGLLPPKVAPSTSKSTIPPILDNTTAIIRDWVKTFMASFTWRYAWSMFLALIIVCTTTVYLTLQFVKPDTSYLSQSILSDRIVKEVQKAGVKIDIYDKKGKIIRQAPGIVSDPNGLILTSLSDLNGANAARVTLSDGNSLQIESVLADNERNLAILKVEKENLSALKLSKSDQLKIGEKVVNIADPTDLTTGITSAIITKYLSPSKMKAGESLPYVQLASATSITSRGILVNKNGEVIGMTIQQQENSGIAVVLNEKTLEKISTIDFKPLSSINPITYSSEALNFYLSGILAKQEGDVEKAMNYYKSAIELDNDLEGAHLELSGIYYDKGMYDLEVEEYKEVLRINPNNVEARFYLALSYDQAGLYDQAIEQYEKILQIDPRDKETLYELGVAYVIQGQIEKALANYETLKFLNPGHAGKLKKIIEVAQKAQKGS